MADLNLVVTTVCVSGKKVHFAHLKLQQAFNQHSWFEIEIDHTEFSGRWMDDAIPIIKYIGLDVAITMQHRQTGEQNLFSGTITNVSFSGSYGKRNFVIITGASPTIKLDGKPTMDSFMDLPLQQVVDEAVANSGNGASVIINPKFGSRLDYVCQYNESCFDFLNRLSWQFGEWFFYDGLDIYFGIKYPKSVTLEYEKEMTYFDLSANLVPQKFNRYTYLKHGNKGIDTDDPANVPGIHGYLQVSKGRSDSVYTSEATTPLMPDVNTKKDLDDLVKAEKSRAVGEMLIIRGETQTCKVKIGSAVRVRFPEKMNVELKSVDSFLVTQVTHVVDQDGHYSNSFSGIIDEIEVVPMAEPKIPIAQPQIATVKTNKDTQEKGRVKVEFQWQKAKNKTTNWIRSQSLDAGACSPFPKNRGHVFIPEIGDQVMLGFEYGDPSRPYVTGSMFPENKGEGGGVNNNIKSIKTRSGHLLEFNDDESGSWGITVRDINGNEIQLDTKGKNILITAPETIQLTANNIILSAASSINASAGEDITSTAGKNFSSSAGNNMIDVVRNDYNMMATNITELAKENYQSEADNIKQVSVKDLSIQSTDGKVEKNAKTRIDNNSGSKSTFH